MQSSNYDRHPFNKGDFYINNGVCIACGAPEAEAQDIIEHSKSDNHCYFKKQPVTEDEIDQAIKAMMVSCINALRYGGQDEIIIKRLYQNGMEDLCDNKAKDRYKILIRDRIHFNFLGTLADLSELLVLKYKSISPYVKVEDYKTNQVDSFSFTQKWTRGASGIIYTCHLRVDKTFEITITLEKGHEQKNIIGISAMLHDFLKSDNRVINIKWFELDKPNDLWYDKPY
ncbi:ferredoxin [Niastella caeni]|uniref:Ferredoxin n=1 Tax=Niastella caeni TaxID=2569763 RepID=A0A4S8HBV1_9BACT|nr:ferredoxin [Niastella caeni]THU31579.1 ferredoxin [Niastella caeni]